MSGSWRDVIASVRAFRVSWAQVRLAIQTSIAAIGSYALATSFALPQSYWAVFTGILVVQASVGASLAAATDRFLATILGGAVGAVLIALFGTSPAATVMTLAGSVLSLAYLGALRPSMRLASVTAAIVILADPHFGDPIVSAWNRVLEIGIGAVVAVVISLTVFPARAGAALAAHLGRALPLFAEQLRRTIDAALGVEYEESALLASSASIRAALITGDTLTAEARRELAGHLAEHADPAALMRTLRRLYHTEIMLARAARGGLHPEAVHVLRPALEDMRETATAVILDLARACAAGRSRRHPSQWMPSSRLSKPRSIGFARLVLRAR
jgi:uncharacterized membrane protein YccC